MLSIPGVDAGQVDVFPTKRRDVLEQCVGNVSALSLQMSDSAVEIGGVPVHDRTDDEIEARRAECLALECAVTDFSALVEEHRAFELMRCLTIEDAARDRRGSAPRGLINVVVEHIRAQVLTGSVSIDSDAQSIDTSVRTLQRELNRAGTDFRSLASVVRIRRATELLRHTNGSITRVSAELGYSSQANFARAFRKVTGSGPREFRSNM